MKIFDIMTAKSHTEDLKHNYRQASLNIFAISTGKNRVKQIQNVSRLNLHLSLTY